MGIIILPNLKFLFANIWHFIALGFGTGLSKYAPGSLGTLVAFIYFYFVNLLNFQYQIFCFCLILIISFVSTQITIQNLNMKDPSCVVIDEIIAFLFILILLPPNYLLYGLSFIIFRILDIFKPWPINYLEKLPGATGVIADDVGAAIGSLLLTYFIFLYVLN